MTPELQVPAGSPPSKPITSKKKGEASKASALSVLVNQFLLKQQKTLVTALWFCVALSSSVVFQKVALPPQKSLLKDGVVESLIKKD